MKKSEEKSFYDLTSKMRIFDSDFKKISEIEKSGDLKKLSDALIRLDKKQAGISLKEIAGFEKAVINDSAIKVKESSVLSLNESAVNIKSSVLAGLFASNKLKCECIAPFSFNQLRVLDSISGPATSDVTRGVIGAKRYYDYEYKIYNSGDTNGTTRVHMVGSLDILFSAAIPSTGRYCILLPVGDLWISGLSRVLGHGNSSTCYDSKIWVDFFSFLHLDGNILESSHSDIHYDGTRSEDRTKSFFKIITFDPRYLFFNANAGQTLELILRLQIDTAANEDGKTWGYVNLFGFPANNKTDYDTMIIKS